jgi:hypothetical protein
MLIRDKRKQITAFREIGPPLLQSNLSYLAGLKKRKKIIIFKTILQLKIIFEPNLIFQI